MSKARNKIIQYLNEAHASEVALTRVLQSQITMTPQGGYREALEKHLGETRDHGARTRERLRELGAGDSPVQAVTGIAQSVAGQALALSKTPLDLLRGHGGDEKVLKNAKDAAATEALEIATYTSLERLARSEGDDETADLAASIRADEERMLRRVLSEIPQLTGRVVGAQIEGDESFDLGTTGAAQAAKGTARVAKGAAKGTAKRAARRTRQVPGAARAEGRARGAAASASDLPIARYDALTAEEIVAKLPELSQVDLAKVDTYERKNKNRATITERVQSLQAKEPWAGYDEQSVQQIVTALKAATDEKARDARTYERAHKDRAGVIEATERELANA